VDSRETWLAATLVELVENSVTGDFDDVVFDESEYGGILVSRMAELLGDAEIGLIMQDPADIPYVVAASSERIRDLLAAELAEDDGPCVACYRTGERLLNLEVATVTRRWPRIAPLARAYGFRFTTALPMRRHGDIAGVAGILHTGQPSAESDIDLAQALLEAAAVGLRQRRRLLRITLVTEQLQFALDSRVLVEQAKGMVAASLGTTPDGAINLMQDYAQRHHALLTDVVSEVIGRKLAAADLVADALGARQTRSAE
jgi:GAF domain-containing protein